MKKQRKNFIFVSGETETKRESSSVMVMVEFRAESRGCFLPRGDKVSVAGSPSTVETYWEPPWVSFCSFDTAAAAKSRQSCPTLCDRIDGSPTGSSVPGILQARTPLQIQLYFKKPSFPTTSHPLPASTCAANSTQNNNNGWGPRDGHVQGEDDWGKGSEGSSQNHGKKWRTPWDNHCVWI